MYLGYFGFSELPFDIVPGVRYFCEVNNQETVFNQILYSLENGEWFLTLTGEVGTGKTLLCNRLLEELKHREDKFTTVYLCGYFDTPLSLYKTLAQELKAVDLENKDSFALSNLINDYLLKEYASGRQVILIFDEAQSCSDEILEGVRLLSNLETSSRKLVQILLVGQPKLNQRLDASNLRQLRERIVANFILEKISDYRNFKLYLNGRLRVAGYVGLLEDLFTEQALKQLWQLSEGIPRRINMLAHRLLIETFISGRRTCDREILSRVKRENKVWRRGKHNYWQKLKSLWGKGS